jgi:hypothetical protein
MVEELPIARRPDSAGRRWKVTIVTAILLVGASCVLGSSSDNPKARASAPQPTSATTAMAQAQRTTTTTTPVVSPVVTTPSTSVVATPATTTPATTTPATATPVAPAIPVAPAPAVVVAAPVVTAAPSVAAWVSEVEASGIDPGSNWSWSMGDTATHCGAMSGAGTGCTYGSGGLEYSVFSGSPTLALVAHELANAETQNDAVPSLLSQVAAAAGGTTWSPTDGVASCLVVHFMGFQDGVAGAWQCPASLASTVAADIHEAA